jgi:hypothetical protein
MKNVFRKVLSILMAFVVMFSTMSFSIDMHYCGNSLVDFSFFTEAKGCGMEEDQSVKNCENPFISENSCCTDQQIIKEGEDDLKTAFNNLSFEQQTFVASFFYTYINLFDGLDENISPFKDYSPPFIERDVQVLHQTFLI